MNAVRSPVMFDRQDGPVGIERIRVTDDGGFDMYCDCAAVTHVNVRIEAPPGVDPSLWRLPGGGFAVTCDGCGRSHWFVVGQFYPAEGSK